MKAARLPEGSHLVLRSRLRNIMLLGGALAIDLLLHDMDIYILDVVTVLNTYHSFLV